MRVRVISLINRVRAVNALAGTMSVTSGKPQALPRLTYIWTGRTETRCGVRSRLHSLSAQQAKRMKAEQEVKGCGPQNTKPSPVQSSDGRPP